MSVVLVVFLFTFSACRKREPAVSKPVAQPIDLTVYAFDDDYAVLKPFFDDYTSKHPTVRVKTFQKFDDMDVYADTLLNEIADGGGPDILYFPNTWLARNWKKLTPMPVEFGSTDLFEQTYVDVASQDLLHPDETGANRVYGIPISVDTLAIFYNKAQFEDRIPEQGRPSITWDGFKEDVYTLTKSDQSFERFEVAGAALGRADNVRYAVDILYLLMLQYKTQFYNDSFTQAAFSRQQGIVNEGQSAFPGVDALKLFTSFALANQKNYTWNEYISDPDSDMKEVSAFAKGKVSMIFGYSTTYDDIVKEIETLKTRGVSGSIDASLIRTAPVPQLNDPQTSTEKRVNLAKYFAFGVSRNSSHSKEAWDLITYLGSDDVVSVYNQKTKRPVSRRDLLADSSKDPIFGVFGTQVGFAESPVVYDVPKYVEIFSKAIQMVVDNLSPQQALKAAEDAVTALLPKQGLMLKVLPKSKVP